ncbi:MAG: hypothetical protein K8R21_04475 [Leptospira sp.]|nr:hypothetical protein [Leptospira sp.]
MKLPLIIFLAFTVSFCAPKKKEVSDVDLKRLIDRIAQVRLSMNLDLEEGAIVKSDKEIFLEAIDVLRLDPDKAREKIKTLNPKLYDRISGENEN